MKTIIEQYRKEAISKADIKLERELKLFLRVRNNLFKINLGLLICMLVIGFTLGYIFHLKTAPSNIIYHERHITTEKQPIITNIINITKVGECVKIRPTASEEYILNCIDIK